MAVFSSNAAKRLITLAFWLAVVALGARRLVLDYSGSAACGGLPSGSSLRQSIFLAVRPVGEFGCVGIHPHSDAERNTHLTPLVAVSGRRGSVRGWEGQGGGVGVSPPAPRCLISSIISRQRRGIIDSMARLKTGAAVQLTLRPKAGRFGAYNPHST